MRIYRQKDEEFIPDVLIPSEKDIEMRMVKSVLGKENVFPGVRSE